jgi:multidrug efflux pump
VAGVTLYLQPTQDLTIDAETGPTQFRVSLEGSNNATVVEWATKLAQRMRQLDGLRNVASDAGSSGAGAYITVDRDTASRLAITTSSIDDALYSAFGQRIVSTIFTETNQYRVILEAMPDQLAHAGLAGQPAAQNRLGHHHAAVGHCHHRRATRAAADHPRGPVPGHHAGL